MIASRSIRRTASHGIRRPCFRPVQRSIRLARAAHQRCDLPALAMDLVHPAEASRRRATGLSCRAGPKAASQRTLSRNPRAAAVFSLFSSPRSPAAQSSSTAAPIVRTLVSGTRVMRSPAAARTSRIAQPGSRPA